MNTNRKKPQAVEIFSQNWNCEKIYTMSDLPQILENLKTIEFVTDNKKQQYLNAPFSFDIETTSYFSKRLEKRATMYAWCFCLCGYVVGGRTWSEFLQLCETIVEFWGLHPKKKIIVYVHNLSYEFQFMRKYFQWEKIFAIDNRKPIYAITQNGIEFRCSYLLTGYSLANVGKNLQVFKIKKMVGDLDYEKIRHSKTPLTPTEWGYIKNDVLVVTAHIVECMLNEKNISAIPLTKTGYVRRLCRNNCYYSDNKHAKRDKKTIKYKQLMKNLTLTDTEYTMLKRAFQGGFTHANAWKTGRIFDKVTSYDFTSSYPAVMLAEKYPMSRGEQVEIKTREQFEHCLKCYCCLFDLYVEIIDGCAINEHILSYSRCRGGRNFTIDNGRVVHAEQIIITLTDVDYISLKKFYKLTGEKIGTFYRYKRGYLPTDFVKTIIELYIKKTTLKGVENMAAEYLAAKENVNSLYGMAVTDICRDIYEYNTEWEQPKKPDLHSEIEKYNKSRNRFLFYPWGVWVTAYARQNLFTGIIECGSDYIYADTDSIKILNAENHKNYFEKYNEKITEKIETALKFHGIDPTASAPKTINGVAKPLGVWDFDGFYTRFKTLGAKRYLTETTDGIHHLTVAGLNKQTAVEYMEKLDGDIFDIFTDSLYIPPDYTGKLTHTYIDEPFTDTLTDYFGNVETVSEKSYIHLGGCEYSLSLSDTYIEYLLSLGGLKNEI